MEMTLRLPNNYVEIEEEEMMYLDGGWSITINRSTVNAAAAAIWGWYGVFEKLSKTQIAGKIASYSFSFAKAVMAKAGFGAFTITTLAWALAGIVAASSLLIAGVYLFNTSVTIGF